jgi:hypothetical protein
MPNLSTYNIGITAKGRSMELDISHFQKPKQPKPSEGSRQDSVEAPVLPAVIAEQIAQSSVLEGEILPPPTESVPPTVPVEPIPTVPTIPIALRGFDLDKISSRAEMVRALTANLPLNEFNLPIFLYRPDMLDHSLLLDSENLVRRELEEMIDAAEVQIDYAEGFPTIQFGSPIWSQLPFEGRESFQAFLEYLELPGTRGIHHVTSVAPELVSEWYHLYYWKIRATAYDLFRMAHHARLREQRILSVEGDHYALSERLFKRLSKALGTKTDEDLAGMEFSELVTNLEKVARLQRQAAGLSATGGGKDDMGVHRPTSVEVVMRQTAQEEGSKQSQADELDMSAILQDENALKSAQELILRVHR